MPQPRDGRRCGQRIFKRELEPGSWIDELKIAEEFGISRTPLREALKVLAAEGLVTMKVRRGAYVTEVSQQDLADVHHLLRLLEIANNRWRDQMVADLRKVMKLNRHNSLLKTGRIEESLAEHRAIMDALAARDPALTAQRMAEHFANELEAAT
jgi:DNA-binding GntR family transcriptional regulator